MDDRFMYELRRDPDPRFAAELRDRLGRDEHMRQHRARRWRPALAAVAAVAAVVALFAFPSVRASAQAVLDLFRVRTFAAVEFDPSRLDKLRDLKQDNTMLVFGKQEVLRDPGPAQEVATPAAASALAGITVSTPAELPQGLTLRKVLVEGAGEAKLTANAGQLRDILAALDIRDLDVPEAIDGKSVTVRKPPVVIQQYANQDRTLTFVQARQPDVELPAGVDLGRLAEIGMRIIGVDKAQARRLARSIDWHTTLVVPVPMNASTFRGVEVHGHSGLLITTAGKPAADGKRPREGTVLMWSEGDRVFAMESTLHGVELMAIAESVR